MFKKQRFLILLALIVGILWAVFPDSGLVIGMTILILGMSSIKVLRENSMDKHNRVDKVFTNFSILAGIWPFSIPMLVFFIGHGFTRMLIVFLSSR